jgi:hypothetical protein
MYGVSDGLAKERKEKEQKEEDTRWRVIRDNERREDRRKTQEERVSKLEEKLERVMRENEERWKERDERLKVMEGRLESDVSGKGGGGKKKYRSVKEQGEGGFGERDDKCEGKGNGH